MPPLRLLETASTVAASANTVPVTTKLIPADSPNKPRKRLIAAVPVPDPDQQARRRSDRKK